MLIIDLDKMNNLGQYVKLKQLLVVMRIREKRMKRKWMPILLFGFFMIFASDVYGHGGFYLGLQAGYSAQKPSLNNVEFNTDTAFLYGARAGIKFMMIALEVNYFQAAHNLELKEFGTFDWGERQIDYSFIGLNLKYFFPILVFHPYITVGYGYYTADIHNIDKDKDKGFNFGLGMELHLGNKFSLLAEGKYNQVKVKIDERDLKLGDFTIAGGFNIYF